MGKGREGINLLLLSVRAGKKEERAQKRDETKKIKLEEEERRWKFPSRTFAEVRRRKV